MYSPIILHMDTATKVCSVSISKGHEIIALKEIKDDHYSHSEKLHVFIEDILKKSNIDITQLNAVCVSKGPGSYTGLRIGVSAAKGLCYALDIPMLAIDTLKIMAMACIEQYDFDLYVPMIDARRMEVYMAIYDNHQHCVVPTCAEVIDTESFLQRLETQKIIFFGSGSQKCKMLINHPNAHFLNKEMVSSSHMAKLSYEKYTERDFEDTAHFEPHYLKDFVVNKKKATP